MTGTAASAPCVSPRVSLPCTQQDTGQERLQHGLSPTPQAVAPGPAWQHQQLTLLGQRGDRDTVGTMQDTRDQHSHGFAGGAVGLELRCGAC